MLDRELTTRTPFERLSRLGRSAKAFRATWVSVWGLLAFYFPNVAFAGLGEREALIQDVFGRLNDTARARSEPLVRPFLAAASFTTRT